MDTDKVMKLIITKINDDIDHITKMIKEIEDSGIYDPSIFITKTKSLVKTIHE
jgi:hypothetical protein